MGKPDQKLILDVLPGVNQFAKLSLDAAISYVIQP
jgi:hypothetical protein